MTDIVDSTAVEETEPMAPAEAVAVIPVPAQPPVLGVAPQASPKDLVARLDAIKETQKLAMEEGVDYGVIPGTDKPTLFKPGAEKLAALFQLDVQPANEKRWEEDGHLTVVSRVTIFNAPTGQRLGSGEGVCTTRERKYAYRKGQRVCPDCGQEAIIKGREEYGGGWLCFGKKGGCGHKWPDGAEVIEGQSVEDIPNPDLPDLWNTVDKMATKRALVAAVLIVTGASAVFTQDVEDMALPSGDAAADQPAAQQKSAPKPPSKKQLDFLERLIGENYAEPQTAQVRSFVPTLNGAQVSKAISGLKDGDEQVKNDLAANAAHWLSQQSDVPADTAGLDQSDEGFDDLPFGDEPEAQS